MDLTQKKKVKRNANTVNKINRFPAARDKLSRFLQTVPAFLIVKQNNINPDTRSWFQ